MDGKTEELTETEEKTNGLNSETLHRQRTNPRQNFRRKQNTGSKDTLHSCWQCGKLCKTMSALKTHSSYKHPDKEINVKCAICDKKCQSLMKLLLHVRNKHHKIYECKVCFTNFATQKQFNDHEQRCAKMKTTCEICGEIFDAKLHNDCKRENPENMNNRSCDFGELSKHMTQTHKQLSESYSGNEQSLYSASLINYTNKYKYHCGICKNRFNSIVDVVKHVMSSHTQINQ